MEYTFSAIVHGFIYNTGLAVLSFALYIKALYSLGVLYNFMLKGQDCK